MPEAPVPAASLAAGPVRPVERLAPLLVEKVWGRASFGDWGGAARPNGRPVGEIIHQSTERGDAELLVKTLFTSERLSVQVHPTAAAARALGLPRGKDEAWIVLAAEPGAEIGLGLNRAMDSGELRAAVADGGIAAALDWRPCAPGDVFFAPAGTIHAIGAGVTLFEVQQNLDLTYRLYDYGRARPLQVEAALAVAATAPSPAAQPPRLLDVGRYSLLEGPTFTLERLVLSGRRRLSPFAGRPVWLAVAQGAGRVEGEAFQCGEVWLADGPAAIEGEGELILAYPGAGVAPGLVSA